MKNLQFLNNKNSKIKSLDYILLFVFFLLFFWFFINNIYTDIQDHINAAAYINAYENRDYPPHFLFFLLVNLFSGFSNNVPLMIFVTSVILSLSIVFKYGVTKSVLRYTSSKFSNAIIYESEIISILSFICLFCFAIPDIYNFFYLKMMYLGRMPSTVWHNSTTIMLFPFAILLFFYQMKIFESDRITIKDKSIWIACSFVFLNIVTKPSFLLIFIPVSFIFIFFYQKNKPNWNQLLVKLIPPIFAVFLIGIQYVALYVFQYGSFNSSESSLGVGKIFEFYREFVPLWYIPLAILLSYAFPILTMIVYPEILKNKLFVYALLLAVFGILLSAFVIELGPRKSHGNLTWQNIIASYLLLITALSYILPKKISKEKHPWKLGILYFVFFLHFIAGIIYLSKLYFTGIYH